MVWLLNLAADRYKSNYIFIILSNLYTKSINRVVLTLKAS